MAQILEDVKEAALREEGSLSDEQPPAPAGGQSLKTRVERVRSRPLLQMALGTFIAILCVYPLMRVISRLFYADGSFTLEPIRETLAEDRLGIVVMQTLVIVVASSTLALIIGGTMAWLNERTDARMGVVTDSLPLVNFILPQIAGSIGWVFLASPRAGFLNGFLRWVLGFFGIHMDDGPFNIFSWYGIIFAYTVNLVPFAFLSLTAGLRQLDPSLEEQSRASGASWFRTLRRVTFPAVRPSIGAAVILMVWVGLALFSVPAILTSGTGIETISMRIVRSLTFGFPPRTGVAVGIGCMLMIVMGTVWLAQRRVLRAQRFSTVSGKQRRAQRIKLGKWQVPARAFMLTYLMAAVVLPIGALLLVSLNGFWTLDIDWGGLSLAPFKRAVLDDPITWEAFKNSVRLAALIATLGVLIAAIISDWLIRTPSRFGKTLDGAIKFPATMPSVILATGFLLTFNGPPFNLGGTFLILVLAFLVICMPEASVLSDAAAGQVGRELVEASSISGASRRRTFSRVSLPLMLNGLIAAWALLFVRTVGDANASTILARSNNMMIGYRMLYTYEHGGYANLGMVAMTLTLISITIITVMFTISRMLSRWQGGGRERPITEDALTAGPGA